MICSDTFSSEILEEFTDVFIQLPFRALRKRSPENMPALPEYLLRQTWMSQRNVLGNQLSVCATF
jgi:hypothetical protein